jgi:hypothetical protein
VLDALTGIAYEDDSQVCECRLAKAFGSPARVEIRVSTAEGVPKTPLEAVPPGLPFCAADLTRRPR